MGDVAPPEPERITANERAFTVLVRNAMFRRVELAARRRWQALADLDAEAGSPMSVEDWSAAGESYFAEHDSVDTGPDARGPRMLVIDKSEKEWRIQQILGDPEGDHDWRITAPVDLPASDEQGELALEVTGLIRLLRPGHWRAAPPPPDVGSPPAPDARRGSTRVRRRLG